jgi:hypothetical protein
MSLESPFLSIQEGLQEAISMVRRGNKTQRQLFIFYSHSNKMNSTIHSTMKSLGIKEVDFSYSKNSLEHIYNSMIKDNLISMYVIIQPHMILPFGRHPQENYVLKERLIRLWSMKFSDYISQHRAYLNSDLRCSHCKKIYYNEALKKNPYKHCPYCLSGAYDGIPSSHLLISRRPTEAITAYKNYTDSLSNIEYYYKKLRSVEEVIFDIDPQQKNLVQSIRNAIQDIHSHLKTPNEILMASSTL